MAIHSKRFFVIASITCLISANVLSSPSPDKKKKYMKPSLPPKTTAIIRFYGSYIDGYFGKPEKEALNQFLRQQIALAPLAPYVY